jgi:hypothetical protein
MGIVLSLVFLAVSVKMILGHALYGIDADAPWRAHAFMYVLAFFALVYLVFSLRELFGKHARNEEDLEE